MILRACSIPLASRATSPGKEVFANCHAWSFLGLASRIPPLGSMFNFDANVKQPHVTKVKTTSVEG